MNWEIVVKGLGLLVFGLLFIRLGVDGWQHRKEERISIIEAAVLKSGGEKDPIPLTRWDRALAHIQPILFLIFGPLMVVTGLGVLSLLGE